MRQLSIQQRERALSYVMACFGPGDIQATCEGERESTDLSLIGHDWGTAGEQAVAAVQECDRIPQVLLEFPRLVSSMRRCCVARRGAHGCHPRRS